MLSLKRHLTLFALSVALPAVAFSIFLLLRAHYTEAREVYESLIAHPLGGTPTVGRAWCLSGLGTIVFNQGGDGPRSIAAFDESVAICRQLEARRMLAWVLTCRALPLMRSGRGGEAHDDCTEAVALARDEGYQWGEASARAILGLVLIQRGDQEGARFQMQTSIDLCLALGNHPVLDANTVARMRVGPSGDIAGGEDARDTRLQVLVHCNTAVHG